ncbi:tyrosine-type recombinase/integrase [Lactococcus garvieae]|uniref:Site-specific integrase n=1 Tax=Lactococcus garvieae TaxID=1363 RepID=A0AA46TVX6_9LACT|nr:site-specific integrase [Lactococcus garvieae]UYT10382.1 site-specific integrase [Lactococcus garvieae]UYT12423.1 site-specific integrase [Lactococcus garvieae]
MASVIYRQRNKTNNIWSYEIRDKGKAILTKSGFKTKKEAQIEAEPILQKIRTGTTLNRDMTLPQLYQKWLNLKIKSSNRTEETLRKYQYKLDKINELFENQKIKDIKPSDYQLAMNKLGKKLGRNLLGRINSDIRKCIQLAIADKLMIDDFTINVELHSQKTKQTKDEKYIHSEQDYQNILKELKKKMDYQKSVSPYIIYFLFKTGMRYGELVALTWEDVDYKNQLLYTYRRFNTTRVWDFVPPKNETSVRHVPIDEYDIELLKKLKEQQKRYFLELELSNPVNFIFAHYGLKNFIPSVATVNKALTLLLKQLNISPIITTKGARHTYGSILLSKGFDMYVTAKIMGHKDISMLIEVYGHAIQETTNKQFISIKQGILEKVAIDVANHV